jgi:hypothetical protein
LSASKKLMRKKKLKSLYAPCTSEHAQKHLFILKISLNNEKFENQGTHGCEAYKLKLILKKRENFDIQELDVVVPKNGIITFWTGIPAGPVIQKTFDTIS